MKRVLIVEDDQASALSLRGLVQSVAPGCSVELVADAEKAILLLAQENSAGRRYDLVVTDISLTGKLTGLELWELHDEFFPTTPVAFTSSLGKAQYRLGLPWHRSAPPPYLQKPYRQPECRNILRSLLAHA